MNKFAKKNKYLHKSILLAETLKHLKPQDGALIVDATLGLGGHAEAILSMTENCKVIGIDNDIEAVNLAKKRLKCFGDRLNTVHANFSEITDVLRTVGVEKVDGVIADLGVSGLQLDSPRRGFSFRFDAPLDMRMNTESKNETAAELLESLSEKEIANTIYEYGEERFSRQIAKKIVEKRNLGEPVKTTFELVKLVERSIKRKRKDKIHPATRTFQALRIAVNKELENLERFLRDSIDILKEGGRLVVITFHSLEDRIAKRTLQNLSGKCLCSPNFPKCICEAEKKVEILTRKPCIPSRLERRENPRSRSAKLRACLKTKQLTEELIDREIPNL